MLIPGLPETITPEQTDAALADLGLPIGHGRITNISIQPDKVEVTFLRESADPDPNGGSITLLGGRSSLAVVTVPIAIRPPR